MGRVKRGLLFALLALAALIPLIASAQDATPLVPVVVTIAPTATAIPVDDGSLAILISARSDLELLAQSTMGDARPTGWNSNLNTADPQLAIYIRLDLELLAGQLMGAEQRPAGWFGAVGSTLVAIARDVRHDLELLADARVNPGVRPPGWVGSDPLMRCNRATQSLVSVLERTGYALKAAPSSPTFCQDAELETSLYVEQHVLAAPVTGMTPVTPTPPPGVNGSIRPGLRGAAVFADRNARQQLGVLPFGIPFVAVARSTAQFSNMMLVQGSDFEVFVDYTFTSLSLGDFETLPDLTTVAQNVRCAAEWCG